MFDLVFITTNLTTDRKVRCINWALDESVNKLTIVDQSKVHSTHNFCRKINHIQTHEPQSAISARSIGLRHVSKNSKGIFFLDDDIEFDITRSIKSLVLLNKIDECISFTLTQNSSNLKIFLTALLSGLLRWGEYSDNRAFCIFLMSFKKTFEGYRKTTSAGLMYIPAKVVESGVFELLKCRGEPIQGGDVELAKIIFKTTGNQFFFSSDFFGNHLVNENAPNKTINFIYNRLEVKNIILGYYKKGWRYYSACIFDLLFALSSSIEMKSTKPLRVFCETIR